MLSIDLLYLIETLLYTVTCSTHTQVAKLAPVPVPECPLSYPYLHPCFNMAWYPYSYPSPFHCTRTRVLIVVPVPVPVPVFQHGLVPVLVPIPFSLYPYSSTHWYPYPYLYPCFNMAWYTYSYPYPFHSTRTRVPDLVPVPVFGTRLQLCHSLKRSLET